MENGTLPATHRDVMPAPTTDAAQPPLNPMEMISRALERGGDVAMIEKLIEMADVVEQRQARRDFDNAVAEAKRRIRPIVKTKKGAFGKYAPIGALAKAIDPILGELGLSYRWPSIERNGNQLNVTCRLSHLSGHSEDTTFPGQIETDNRITLNQQVGKATTYGRRYSLEAALGLTTIDADLDDDTVGRSDLIGADDAHEVEEWAARLQCLKRLCGYFDIENVSQLKAGQVDEARRLLRETEERRASESAAKEAAE